MTNQERPHLLIVEARFYDALADALLEGAKAALDAASRATGACDLFLSIGTSSLVYPAAALPYEALENGATLVEINPNETPLTPHSDYSLRGAAGQVLPDLLRMIYGPPTSR